ARKTLLPPRRAAGGACLRRAPRARAPARPRAARLPRENLPRTPAAEVATLPGAPRAGSCLRLAELLGGEEVGLVEIAHRLSALAADALEDFEDRELVRARVAQ